MRYSEAVKGAKRRTSWRTGALVYGVFVNSKDNHGDLMRCIMRWEHIKFSCARKRYIQSRELQKLYEGLV